MANGGIGHHLKVGATMNIQQATRSFESWMRSCTTVIESDLRSKHEKMKADLFMFFRGTFYRWAQLWPEICHDLLHAPKVLGVGDLHDCRGAGGVASCRNSVEGQNAPAASASASWARSNR